MVPPTWILGKEGADTRTLGRLYLVVVQATLLFGSETWVTNPCMESNLVGGSLPGGKTSYGITLLAPILLEMELASVGGSNSGGRDRGYGGIYLDTAEYSDVINFYQAHTGPMTGDGNMPMGKCGKVLAGTAGDVSSGSTGGWGDGWERVVRGGGVIGGAKRKIHN